MKVPICETHLHAEDTQGLVEIVIGHCAEYALFLGPSTCNIIPLPFLLRFNNSTQLEVVVARKTALVLMQAPRLAVGQHPALRHERQVVLGLTICHLSLVGTTL